MKTTLLHNNSGWTFKKFISTFLLLSLFASFSWAQSIPYTVANNSIFADNEVYICMVGKISGSHVWMDVKTGVVRSMNVADNTVAGPVYSGNKGPGNNGMYSNYFSKLSDIPNKTINVPRIEGCRIFISFKSQLYLYVFGASGGYAGVSLSNATDPNTGIRFEMIELTNANNGLWSNTTRVDSYQYPMGLEVWGNNGFYKKIGEMKTHDQIIAQWKATAPAEFQTCYDATNNIIKFPTKNASFLPGGAYANYFQPYIDAIWSKYTTADLVFTAGDIGVWKGRVSGDKFTFTRTTDGAVGVIARKPSNLEVMEGSTTMAEGAENDKNVQKFICASINRHVIDLNAASGVNQIWSDDSKYYQTSLYNWYCKFFHSTDISYEAQTYTFCYDDVYDKSSTINCPSAIKALITIGGFAGANIPVSGVSLSSSSATINVGGTTQLTANITPSNATNKTVIWTTSDGSKATVSSTGLVSGVAVGGPVTITATTQDGGFKATCSITVLPVSTNLALNKPVTVSSTESASYPGSYAVDGNGTTRWASAFSDPQWIYVDLGATYDVNRVKITWEAAYGKDFTVQVSANASTWSTIKTVTGNSVLVNDYTGLTGTGRYVRINGTARGTAYGYSIFELEVYGTPNGNIAVTGVSLNASTASINVGGTTQLTANVTPSNATNKTVLWTTSDGSKATVSSTGLVSAVSAGGPVTITATTQDGGFKATCSVTVLPVSTNLALNKPVTVSSTESASYPGSYAVDGNGTTRWASAFSDPQWIYVDLGATYDVNRVKITWEAAYGKDFTVQVSANASTWSTIKTVTGNSVLINDYTGLTGTGRYVRINGTARGTAYGYSIFGLEVYGTPASSGGGCTLANASGDYSISVSSDASNPTITFVPSRSGVGAPTCILYYNTTGSGLFPGYTVTANTAYRINAAAGQTVYFYYTYTVPEGGERNTVNSKNSFTVGSCSTLKSGKEATEIAQTEESAIEVFPVPMTNELNLRMNNSEFKKATIVDLSGKIVAYKLLDSNSSNADIDVSRLSKGVYVLKLEGENTIVSKKLVK